MAVENSNTIAHMLQEIFRKESNHANGAKQFYLMLMENITEPFLKDLPVLLTQDFINQIPMKVIKQDFIYHIIY